MQTEQQKHIAQIRKERFGLDENGISKEKNPLASMLKATIEQLATDVYTKNAHFIFELIQNAEDNKYTVKEPSLSFKLVTNDPTITFHSDGALFIINNEIGFKEKNVWAICGVGREDGSTKGNKTKGYIGEKGIGFKSVFLVTTRPHILSNGYRFYLPKTDEETGLGYIVPRWIEEAPSWIDQAKTNIILPLDSPKYGYKIIEKMLIDIAPETILFLSTLKEIEIITETDEIIILKNNSEFPKVKISASKNSRDRDGTFLSHTKTFTKPPDVNSEKRIDINERDVSIACPLDEDYKGAGKIFAYLPIRADTNLPFLINADFLLTTNREDVIEDEPWNNWLRDCISDVFADAFEEWLDIDEYRTRIYRFIPIEAHYSFLKPAVVCIHNILKEKEIILTEPDGEKRKPEFARTASKNFRSLLSEQLYPSALLGETRLVLEEIQGEKERLKKIGVKSIGLEEVKECFQDRQWVENHHDDWVLASYQYLSSQKFEKLKLNDCPIVPIRNGIEKKLSCETEQPIYFEYTEEAKKILAEAPACIDVPLAFVDLNFYNKLKDHKDNDKIIDWMGKTLKIKKFSIQDYAIEVVKWFTGHYQAIDDTDMVSVTYFLSQISNEPNVDIELNEIPIFLANGWRMLLSEANDLNGIQAIVTPEIFDAETGWQNVFVEESERSHLMPLADAYAALKDSEEAYLSKMQIFWKKIQITAYPLPHRYERFESEPFFFTEHEKKCFQDSKGPEGERFIENYSAISWIKQTENMDNEIRLKRSRSLLNLLANQGQNFAWSKATIKNNYKRDSEKIFESDFFDSLKKYPWLPTSKGFGRPPSTFLPDPHIKEILGNSVHYFDGQLSPTIIKLLGINENATADQLISALEKQSKSETGSKEFAEKVYRYLNSLGDETVVPIVEKFKTEKLIFIPNDPRNSWVSSPNVIWQDQSEVFGIDFVYIEKIYTDLEGFFINKLGVKPNVDAEAFAQKWIKLQDEAIEGNLNKDKIERVLSTIYKKLLPISQKDDSERPEWWKEFASNAKIWTQRYTFLKPEDVLIPDDGELIKIFQNKIQFAWLPKHNALTDWKFFYGALNVSCLSEEVSSELPDDVEEAKINEAPEYLTDSTIKLILTYLNEKDRNTFERISEPGGMAYKLKKAREAISSKYIQVTYFLEDIEIPVPQPCFWDHKAEQVLFIAKPLKPIPMIKNSIARTIARELMPNQSSTELANWIELVLGSSEKDLKYRIKEKNWRIPIEIEYSPDSQDHETLEHNEIAPCRDEFDEQEEIAPKCDGMYRQNNPLTNRILGNYKPTEANKSSGPSHSTKLEKFDYLSELDQALNRPGEIPDEDDYWDGDDNFSKNPAQRSDKAFKRHQERRDGEPNPEERRKNTERKMLERPDEQVRESLEKWYGGRCQICNNRFFDRDGRPFFIAKYIVERKHARQVDNCANALCLCAEHFAQWLHGPLEAPDFKNKIKSMKLKHEGGDGNYQIPIKLCGKNLNISYVEKHFIDLKALINMAEHQREK
ncbi:MAG: hypothetical protein PF482_13010 [Desulfobacteraceae bacterium]|jgi:hypothetical protein|nr:hypothetical protein [Desulfobacteraceae bacterium]